MRQRGFSLAEALVAEFLMIIAVIFAINIFPITRKALILSENRTRAALLGQKVLNESRASSFEALTNRRGTWLFSGVDDGKPFFQSIDYQLEVLSLDSNLKQVWVVLRWTDGTGTRQLTVESLRTRR